MCPLLVGRCRSGWVDVGSCGLESFWPVGSLVSAVVILPTPEQAVQTVLLLYPLAGIRPAPLHNLHIVVFITFTHPMRHSRISLHHPAVQILLVLAVVVV
jgi:hypothetical protein